MGTSRRSTAFGGKARRAALLACGLAGISLAMTCVAPRAEAMAAETSPVAPTPGPSPAGVSAPAPAYVGVPV